MIGMIGLKIDTPDPTKPEVIALDMATMDARLVMGFIDAQDEMPNDWKREDDGSFSARQGEIVYVVTPIHQNPEFGRYMLSQQ